MGEFFSSDYIWHQTNGKDIRSSHDSSHVAVKIWLFVAIPDVHYTIDHVIAEGDMVAVHTTATGTAKSEMFFFSGQIIFSLRFPYLLCVNLS
ncbi:hypothetical protein BH23BAC1_BH23BAC1_47620 [soil metagenome]